MADSTVTDLDDLLVAAREKRRPLEGQWAVNVAFYLGFQWVRYDGRQLYEPPLEPWQVKITTNLVQPAVRQDIAKMTKTRPSFTGVPSTIDERAIAAARLTERSLDHQWRELNLQRKLRRALLWSRVASAGFWKLCWDKGAGKKVTVVADAEGQVVNGPTGAPMRPQEFPDGLPPGLQTKDVHMGEILAEVRSPLQIFADPIAGDEGLEGCEWIIEETVQSLDYVRSRFGLELAEGDASTFTDLASGLTMPAGVGETGTHGYRGVKVRELWALPSSQHPEGKHVVWTQHGVAFEDKAPYPWLPYVMFSGTPVAGRFWPDAIVSQYISPQTAINKRLSQTEENAQRIGNPTLLVPEGVDYEYEGLVGGELRYHATGNPADIPAYLTAPEMPSYARDTAPYLSALQDISGQHDVSRGTVPSGVTAASAINLLQEADDTRLGPDIAEMEKSLEEAGSRIVYLMQHYYTDERMLRLSGEDGAWDITPFRGKDLEGGADVQVQAGSAMPRSKAAKQAAIQEVLNLALQYGIPVKESDLRRTLQEYEVGGVERLFGDLGVDERQIVRENMLLAQGATVPINAFDNDEAHIAGHERFQKSPHYDRLRREQPDVAFAFDEHTAAHRTRFDMLQAAALPPDPNADQSQLSGAAGGASTVSPVQGG